MGGFYGSTQVRTGDRQSVLTAAEAVARGRGEQCLVGPVLSGWVGVYSQNHGQDHTFAEAIAQKIDADVLHVVVHDDSVMYYWLWRSGQLEDSYCSRPGYFDDADRDAEEPLVGRPEAFAPSGAADYQQLAGILDRRREEAFESERLRRFAGLLEIENALTSYEDLVDGESAGIRGRRQLKRLPSATAGKTGKRKPRGLLMERVVEDPVVVVGPAGDGFLVGMNGLVAGQGGWVERWAPPWSDPVRLPLEGQGWVLGVAADASGERVAVLRSAGIEVWQVSPAQKLRDIRIPDGALQLLSSPDGRVLACASRSAVWLVDSASGETLGNWDCDGARPLGFDADSRWLICSRGEQLRIAEVTPGAVLQARALPAPPLLFGGEYLQTICAAGMLDAGRLLWCSTLESLHIYDWRAIAASSEATTLSPIQVQRTITTAPNGMPIGRQITTAVGEPAGKGIICAVMGRTNELIRFEAGSAIEQPLLTLVSQPGTVALSSDGHSLLVSEVVRGRMRCRVWGYAELLRGQSQGREG